VHKVMGGEPKEEGEEESKKNRNAWLTKGRGETLKC
jgi:hypothetical protein